MQNIQKTNQKPSLKSYLDNDNIKKRIEEVLGKNASTFAASLIQISKSNDMLANAEPSSLLGAAMTAATLNLPINNTIGQAYIVPFKNNKKGVIEGQFQISYKGIKQLAQRSGQYRRLNYGDVREGEIENRDRLSGEITFNFIDDDSERMKRKIIGYFSFYELLNGFTSLKYMSIHEIESHAKRYSQTYKKGFGNWKDDFEKMALKTVVKLHLNSGEAPLSIEMQKAMEFDQASMTYNEETQEIETEYVDNEEVKFDEDHERLISLIKGIKTNDDIEIASGMIPDEEPYASLLQDKIEKIRGKK